MNPFEQILKEKNQKLDEKKIILSGRRKDIPLDRQTRIKLEEAIEKDYDAIRFYESLSSSCKF